MFSFFGNDTKIDLYEDKISHKEVSIIDKKLLK